VHGQGMIPGKALHFAKKLTPSLARWGVAGGSVVMFLGFDDIPGILLETQYGVPCCWKDVWIAAGLIKGPE